jgi:hypothetical protein
MALTVRASPKKIIQFGGIDMNIEKFYGYYGFSDKGFKTPQPASSTSTPGEWTRCTPNLTLA